MKPRKIILQLARSGKSFTNYDVLCILRRHGSNASVDEIRSEIHRLQSHKDFANYTRSPIHVAGQVSMLNHPATVPANSYEANDLTQWEIKRKSDRDGRLSVPKRMLHGLPLSTPLEAIFGWSQIHIAKGGVPHPDLRIQPIRRDLRINPSSLKEAGMTVGAATTYTIERSNNGIRITQ